MPQSSKIFIRNRAIGFVSNHVPAVTRYIKARQANVVVTCVGRSFHTYDTAHLTLLAVSDPAEDEISCLAADSRFTYSAAGTTVNCWRRATVVHQTFKGHKKPVHLLLPFGNHLVSVDEGNVVIVWDRIAEDIFLEIPFDEGSFKITAINHPSTYLNKILLGSEQGQMQLWNIKTSKLVYSFAGWNSAILVLEQAPALDVMAIGLRSGKIILHNLKFDEALMEFSQDWGPVLSISFRTDGPPIMATASTEGHVVLWNLEERNVAAQLLDAHSGAVAVVKFLPNEPLLVTNSGDNSLKMWIFDQSDDNGRLLRLREGHGDQPTRVRFYGTNNFYVLSASGDSSLRAFSTVSDTYNYSLGKASFNRKTAKKKKHLVEKLLMPPIIEFTSETTREKEWDNIAAIHASLPLVTTWSFDKRKMGEHKLLHERFSKQTRAALNLVASSVALTTCGNFVIIGYTSGHVDRFNIQSGIHRCQYGDPAAHKGAVRGVVPDALNQYVVTGSSKGLLKFWPFKPPPSSTICSKTLGSSLNLKEAVSYFRHHKDSSLLMVVLENFDITLVDLESRKLVRRFTGHTGEVTDATFSPDCRWIVSASIDLTIRTWDLPTSSLVDIFKVDWACTSLAFSPMGTHLATTHVNNLGIYLWSNKTLFDEVHLQPVTEENVPTLDLPASSGKEQVIRLEEDEHDINVYLEPEEDKSPEQINDLVTLSGLSSSRWLNLLDIEVIRRRNKPKQQVVKLQRAPFFLPTLPSSEIKFDFSNIAEDADGVKKVRLDQLKNYTQFGNMLDFTCQSNDYEPLVDKLKTMGPSAIDLEINSMAFEAQGSETLMLQFMKLINYMLTTGRDFELAQSYLSLFIKIHGRTIVSTPTLSSFLTVLENTQESSWNKIQSDLMYLLSIVEGRKQSL